MKNSILAIAVIALFAFTSCKKNAADSVVETNVTQAADRDAKTGEFPVMTFDEKQFDFGEITQGTPVEHIFTYTNTGKTNLVVVNAKSSCGCTVPTFTLKRDVFQISNYRFKPRWRQSSNYRRCQDTKNARTHAKIW